MNVLRGQNRLVLGGSLHWIFQNYAESKIAENANSKRKEYSLRNNNCGTFAADVLKQDPSVKDKAPVIIDPRPNSIVKEYQDNFKSLNYDPKKRQVKIE